MSAKVPKFSNVSKLQLDYNAFSESGRKWLANAIAGMVCADGVVAKEELRFLEHAIQLLNNDKELVYDLVARIRARNVPEMVQYREADRILAYKMIMLIAHTAVSDLLCNNAEEKYLRNAAAKLGFDKIFCNELLEWARDLLEYDRLEDKLRISVAQKEEALLKAALTSDVVYN